MLTKKKLSGFVAIILWASSFYMGCSSGDEPGPVDCSMSSLKLTITSSDPTTCGTSNGSITATATGGNEPYQFALDAQAYGAASSFTGLAAGTYQVKVKDKNGCERSASAVLKPFGSTLEASVLVTDSGCKTSTGAITITATGGTGPYSYKVNDGAASSANTFSVLSAGSYLVKVTDNTGCSVTQTLKVLSGVKLSGQIKTIIDANCAVSGCHVAGGAAPVSFTSLANIIASANEIKSRTQSGNMPKNGAKLPQAQLDAIACWVDDGAPNN